ncbi:MAG: SPOR domain-containing protein [Methylococcales bacterium]|nr:SPOR domain-containing protein [Methylococcales bacterium]
MQKMKEKEKNQRNRLNASDDDLILADMHVTQDNEELLPVPLDHLMDDEDAIDRLLIDADFDASAEYAQTDGLIVDDISVADELGQNINELNSAAFVYPPVSDSAKFPKDQAIIRQEYAMTDIKHEQTSASLNEAETGDLNDRREPKQDNIQKRLNGCEHTVKKNAIIAYVSLSIGIIALTSTIAMAVVISGMKKEISRLTDLVSILEEDMSGLAEKNSDMKFNKNDSSLKELNQKVNSFSKQLQEQSQTATEALKNKLTSAGVKQATINKSLGNLQSRIRALEQKKPIEVRKVSVKKAKNIHPAEDWSVHLVSYKEKAYAKTKAAQFKEKGIPVKLTAIDSSKSKLYGLKVDGFKSKLEATSYAVKIKKSLKLNSVSVANNI